MISLYKIGGNVVDDPQALERFCEEFAALLEKRTGLPVVWQDERLTTVEADEILADSGVPASERKQYIDQVAAGLILKEYMAAHPELSPEGGNTGERG